MNKYIIIIILGVLQIGEIGAQEELTAINYIQNIEYKERELILIKPEYKDIIANELQNYITDAIKIFIQGSPLIDKSHDIVITHNPKDVNDFNGKDMIFHDAVKYLAYWEIDKIDLYEHQYRDKISTRISLTSKFTIIDIVKGSIYLSKAINYSKDINQKINRYYYDKKDFEGMFVYLAEQIRAAITHKIPDVSVVNKVNIVKKEKAKSILIKYPPMSFKTRYQLYASVVDKIIKKNGKSHYIFKNIGRLKYENGLKGSRELYVYKVKKGGKEIYEALNENKEIIITDIKIGY